MPAKEEFEEFPQKPHNTLSTPLGRFIERLTYRKLGLTAFFVIFASAGYFCLAAGGCNGLDKGAGDSFGESLYFSVVTFTTLGYGDLYPIGWGRLVAGAEVLIGLCLSALFIGRIASERQSALLLLLYTSDQQRRLSGFSEEIERLTVLLVGSPKMVGEILEDGLALITSLQAYLMFQSHQGRLADFGNGSALRHLYRSINGFLCAIFNELIKLTLQPDDEEAFLNIATRLARLGQIMEQFHNEDRSTRSTLGSIKTKFAEIKGWEEQTVTNRRLNQVFATVPPKPWPKHFHKEAAESIGISNALFRKCMDELIRLKRV